MPFNLKDRVRETTTTVGTSDVVLEGAYSGYRSFLDSGIGDGTSTYYVLINNRQWEVGIGTFIEAESKLTRDTVLSSSIGGTSKISLTGGVSDVFIAQPADKSAFLNPAGLVSGVSFTGYAFPDGSTQTTSAAAASGNPVANAIAFWADSESLGHDAGLKFQDNKFITTHPAEFRALSGIPVTIIQNGSGNIFQGYVDNSTDRTIALNLTDESAPTWTLGLSDTPVGDGGNPTYGYVYGNNGSVGQYATSDTYQVLNYTNGFWIGHKSANILNVSKDNGTRVLNSQPAVTALEVQGAISQSEKLQKWTQSDDSVVAYVDNVGNISGVILKLNSIDFSDGTQQSSAAVINVFNIGSGTAHRSLIDTNISDITTNTNNIVASGASIIDSSTALTIASGTAIRDEASANATSITGNTGSIVVNRDNIVASGTAIINSYTDLVIASGTAERDLTVASGTSIVGQFSSKADLHSPAFAGTPTAPTAAALTNTTQIATTAFVRTEVTSLVDSAPGTLDTLNELASALGDDANFSTTVTNSIATKASSVDLAAASGSLRHDLDLAANSGVDTSGIAFGAYAWGNHADVGYAAPTDFALLYASGAETSGIAWTAYNRGDHRALGLVTHATFDSQGLIKRGSSSGVYTYITDNSDNWNTAYSWGDYVPSGTVSKKEREMLFSSGVGTSGVAFAASADVPLLYASGADTSGIAFGAYSWGNHGSAGYLTSETFGLSSGTKLRKDVDLIFASGQDSSGIAFAAYAWGNHASAGYGSPTDISNLFASGQDTSGIAFAAYAWGNHASAGYLTSETSHADVVVDGDFSTNGLLKRTGAGAYTSVTDNSSNWNNAYSWGDHTPSGTKHARQIDMLASSGVDTSGIAFAAYGWGNHASAGYLTSYTETNNLSSAVTWANVPDANITQSSVVQHSGALKVFESQITDLQDYALLASPTFTGTPAAPTASAATNTTQIATTAFVRTEISNLVDSAPGALDTLNELAAAINDDASFSTTVTNSIATKIGNVVEDTTPQLGGTLDANSNSIDMGTNNITDTKVGQWDTSYGWGDHRALGLVTHSTFGSEGLIKRGSTSGSYSFITDNSSNWNTAYGWGNHASAGYLTSETNNLSSAVTWANVPNSNITESSVTQHQAALSITESQISDFGSYLTSETFTSLVQDTSPQLGGTLDANSQSIDMGTNTITDTKVGQWDTSYGWGDHRALGLVTHGTFGSEGIIKRGSTSGDYSFITDNSSNWNTAHGWGNHASAGYLTASSTNTLTNKTLTSPDINTPDIDGGTIDGATIATSDVTVGSDKTLDVSAGTLTTSAAQNLAIVQGAASNIDIGAYELRAQTLESDVSNGTAPLTVASTTVVTNLNADKLDGQDGSHYLDYGNFVIDDDEIPIAKLAADKVTIGSTDVTLGATVTTFAGLASVTSTAFVGDLTGTSSKVTVTNSSAATAYPIVFHNESDHGSLLDDTGAFTYKPSTGDVLIWNAGADNPTVTIKNSHSGATAGTLKFLNSSSTAGDNAVCGNIGFYGRNDNVGDDTDIQFGKIQVTAADTGDGAEQGSMGFHVAELDGTLTQGLLIAGQDANGEVDVTIGAGAASTTTIAGTLTMGSTAALTNAGLVAVANQSNITGLGTLTTLTVDNITIDASTIDFNGTTGNNKIELTDDLASALDITESSNSYIKFNTQNAGTEVTYSKEAVEISKPLKCTKAIHSSISKTNGITSETLKGGGSGNVVTLDLAEAGFFRVQLTANVDEIWFKNQAEGQKVIIRFEQDGTGSRTVDLSDSFYATDGTAVSVQWPSDTPPTLTTTASKADLIGLLNFGIPAGSVHWYNAVVIGQNFD